MGSYWYDESGFRIRKSSLEPKNNVFSNVEILYPSKFFGLEFIESENVISSVNNVYLNGVRIAALNEAGALAYYLTDQVDSVSTVLDDEGNTLSLMQYLPYGETFVQRGDLNFSPKFNSQELDRESGFYFFNARYYDPGIARFTSADTIIDGELDTLSLAKTKMWEVKSKITDSYDKMKLFEKKRDGEAVKKQIQNMEYNERIDYLK
ncbi:RHS repeat-associated core domain protein [Leptospira interrogans serovar Grippotyphosa str. 2006006986]|nr:RHS repeat-associated core domain protein [Leptospira interrogans serovar Grippotyphosa str. 2006006986]